MTSYLLSVDSNVSILLQQPLMGREGKKGKREKGNRRKKKGGGKREACI